MNPHVAPIGAMPRPFGPWRGFITKTNHSGQEVGMRARAEWNQDTMSPWPLSLPFEEGSSFPKWFLQAYYPGTGFLNSQVTPCLAVCWDQLNCAQSICQHKEFAHRGSLTSVPLKAMVRRVARCAVVKSSSSSYLDCWYGGLNTWKDFYER